jgi:hypothetical protein
VEETRHLLLRVFDGNPSECGPRCEDAFCGIIVYERKITQKLRTTPSWGEQKLLQRWVELYLQAVRKCESPQHEVDWGLSHTQKGIRPHHPQECGSSQYNCGVLGTTLVASGT